MFYFRNLFIYVILVEMFLYIYLTKNFCSILKKEDHEDPSGAEA